MIHKITRLYIRNIRGDLYHHSFAEYGEIILEYELMNKETKYIFYYLYHKAHIL